MTPITASKAQGIQTNNVNINLDQVIPNAQVLATELLSFKEVPDEDYLIFALYLNNYILHEGVVLYQINDKYYISLTGLFEALEFPISVNVFEGVAEGWYLNEDRTFFLDLEKGTAQLSDNRIILNPEKVHRLPDDIYVETDELSKWFPIYYNIDFQNLAINVTSQESLPIEERIAKEDRRKRLFTEDDEFKDFIRGGNVEPLFTSPYVDANIFIEKKPDSITGNGPSLGTQFGLNSSSVILGQDTNFNIFSDDLLSFPIMRMTLGRKSNKRDLLGPLGLNEYSFGDVSTPAIPLVSENVRGRGLVLSTYGLNRLSDSRFANLRGELLPGWEVELYRNETLLAYITENVNGQYEFLNIETLPGVNIFKLIFYGPQGQKIEKFERLFSDGDVTKVGKTNFRLAINQQNKDLIGSSSSVINTDFSDTNATRLQFMGEHGIAENITLASSLSSLSFQGVRREYYQAGLYTNFFAMPTSLNYSVASNGGRALGIRARTSFNKLNIAFERDQYKNYNSEANRGIIIDGILSENTQLSLNGIVSPFSNIQLPYNFRAIHQKTNDGRSGLALYGRVSSRINQFTVTLENQWQRASGLLDQFGGAFLVSTSFGDSLIRGAVDYRILPKIEISRLRLTRNWKLNHTSGLILGLGYLNQENDIANLLFGYNKKFKKIRMNIEANVDSKGEIYAGIGFSLGFGLDPRTQDIYWSNRGLSRDGLISPRVFLDNNNNGTFDDNDELLEDVKFSSNYSTNFEGTDENGQMLMTGMPLYRSTHISVKEESLKDPFLISQKQGVTFELRPGNPQLVEFPISETGEIDGTVNRLVNGEVRPAAGISVFLRREDGKIVSQQKAAYDGFYLFDRILPGKYILELDSNEISLLGYEEVEPFEIEVTSENNMIFGMDYLLKSVEEMRLAELRKIEEGQTKYSVEDVNIESEAKEAGKFGIHLLSFLYERSIQPGWEAIVREYPSILLAKNVKLIPYRNGQVFTRLLVGGYMSRKDAVEACKPLWKDEIFCRVTMFEGRRWEPIRVKNIQ